MVHIIDEIAQELRSVFGSQRVPVELEWVRKLLLMTNKTQKLMTEECFNEQLSVIVFSWTSDLNMSPLKRNWIQESPWKLLWWQIVNQSCSESAILIVIQESEEHFLVLTSSTNISHGSGLQNCVTTHYYRRDHLWKFLENGHFCSHESCKVEQITWNKKGFW